MTESLVQIRAAQPADIDSLVKLLDELFTIENDFTPDAVRQRIGLNQLLCQGNAVILVAEMRGKVIGMCTIQILISTAEGGPVGLLEDLIVTESFHKQGIGKALVTAAENWAVEHNLKRLQLLAEAENDAALAFYFRMGWHSTGLVCRRKKINPILVGGHYGSN